MLTIAGLASNRGRNLLHIAETQPAGAELGVVVSNHADAPILEDAADRRIETVAVEAEPGQGRREHEKRVLDALEGYDIDLVALDGYMRILSDTFLDGVPLTLNVHPSLLPAFPGDDAHEQVLEAGVTITGCTVHVVTNAVEEDGSVIESAIDAGPIVTQEPVPVRPGDDRETLKRRVLYEGEHRAYPRAIRLLAEGAVDIDGNSVAIDPPAGDFPRHRIAADNLMRELRYGENPHQQAAVYRDETTAVATVVDADQHNEGAKALSYNNYNDADAALNLVREFDDPAAAVIKHTNPAGCAVAEDLSKAYDRALATDPKSAFGGIVALNQVCDEGTAASIVDSFKEAVLAPGYTEAALEVLTNKQNLRVLDVGELGERDPDVIEKPIVGGRLLQEPDLQAPSAADLQTVTERSPTEVELQALLFAWQTAKHVKSNAIVLATGTETVGIGMGQASRVDAVELAVRKADRDAEGKQATDSVMASDAFFPFPDGVELAAEAGVEAVIQPGGSKRDEAVIEAADAHGLAMVFTGTRAFRHD